MIAYRVPDIERAIRLILADITPPPTTVGIGVPEDWTLDSPPHLQVGWDGTRITDHRFAARASIRITAWSSSTSVAKDLAAEAEARLVAYRGPEVMTIRPALSILPARDPDTRAELASVVVAVTTRLTLI